MKYLKRVGLAALAISLAVVAAPAAALAGQLQQFAIVAETPRLISGPNVVGGGEMWNDSGNSVNRGTIQMQVCLRHSGWNGNWGSASGTYDCAKYGPIYGEALAGNTYSGAASGYYQYQTWAWFYVNGNTSVQMSSAIWG